MNWLQKISSEFFDSNEDPIDPRRYLPSDAIHDEVNEDRPQLGDRIFEDKGVWLYKFNNVKQDAENGWFLDWFDDPGSISDISKVQSGDKIADHSLNMTPYWEVSYVDEDSGRIYVNPIEPNPFISGIGAGGKKIDDHDMEVFSGEHETSRIDDVLDKIKSGRYSNPRDVSYILLGTVPVNMGPNGAQGGWYSLTDMYSNRGGKQGMTVQDIMMQDAASLKKLGFDIPVSALDGTLDPSLFNNVIESSLPYREEEADQLKLQGENFQDINAMAHFIIAHPQPGIKDRNWESLNKMYYSSAPYNQEVVNPNLAKQILFTIKSVIDKMPNMYHARQNLFGDYDQYEYLKQKAIGFAQRQGWIDLIKQFETTLDPGNRKEVIRSYSDLGMDNDVIRLAMSENNSEPLHQALYGLYKAGKSSKPIIDSDPQKFINILKHRGENTVESYHAEELSNVPIWLTDMDNLREPSGYWKEREEGILVSLEQYLGQARQAKSNWLQKTCDNEHIISAVIYAYGKLFTGENHGVALNKAIDAGIIKRDSEDRIIDYPGPDIHLDLFMTSEGRVIDRFKAFEEFDFSGY